MILNLTMHVASEVQRAADVVEPEDKGAIKDLLLFEEMPTQDDLRDRAASLAKLAKMAGADSAMIGGAPFFMSHLEAALSAVGIRPLFAFSVRRSEDQVQDDGSVRKVATFVHLGFVG